LLFEVDKGDLLNSGWNFGMKRKWYLYRRAVCKEQVANRPRDRVISGFTLLQGVLPYERGITETI
jgi:hypothetical protein